jgi:hypothetical protein
MSYYSPPNEVCTIMMMKKNEKHSNDPRLVTSVGRFFEFLNNHQFKLFMVL